MSLPISRQQMELLNALRVFTQTHGRTPSIRELGKLLNRAASTIHQSLSALQEKRLVENLGGAHGWRINRHWEYGNAQTTRASGASFAMGPMVRIPILGRIAAGRPIEALETAVPAGAEDDPEYSLTLPRDQAPEGTFALRVAGDSMIEDSILDGDIVLVHPQSSVEDGQIAVALLEDGTATLKRIYRDRKHRKIRLQPANAKRKPLSVDRVRIQGRAIGIYRKFD